MKVLAGAQIPPGLLETLDAEQPMLIAREGADAVLLLSLDDLPAEARRSLQVAVSDFIRSRIEHAGESPDTVVKAFYDTRKAGG